jgi:hypothetical protein
MDSPFSLEKAIYVGQFYRIVVVALKRPEIESKI